MSDRIAVPMAEPASAHRRRFFHLDTGAALMWALLAAGCLVILPPFFYLIKSSVTVPLPGSRTAIGLGNYARVIDISGFDLWGVTIAFAAGTSLVAIFLGASIAWLVARTNVAFRQAAFVGAFISLSAPLIVKGIGWILLLGPNNGLVNNWLRACLGIEGTPIELFSLTRRWRRPRRCAGRDGGGRSGRSRSPWRGRASWRSSFCRSSVRSSPSKCRS
jgi:iron(III) transport system permease protein